MAIQTMDLPKRAIGLVERNAGSVAMLQPTGPCEGDSPELGLVLLKQETPASQESFDTLRSANDQLDEALQELQSPRSPSLPSVVPSSQLPGDPVTIDVLPAVRETDGQSRPAALPPADADLVVVEGVDPRSEADVLGIRAGDVLRAVSYVGTGPEPGWLDKMLGAEAMPMKKVMKCDGRSVEEVCQHNNQLQSSFLGCCELCGRSGAML
eukprot:s420_g9.t1